MGVRKDTDVAQRVRRNRGDERNDHAGLDFDFAVLGDDESGSVAACARHAIHLRGADQAITAFRNARPDGRVLLGQPLPALSREIYQIGVELETQRNRSIDFFVARQYDVRAAGSRLTAAGISLAFRY
jgi:hypothetical protein